MIKSVFICYLHLSAVEIEIPRRKQVFKKCLSFTCSKALILKENSSQINQLSVRAIVIFRYNSKNIYLFIFSLFVWFYTCSMFDFVIAVEIWSRQHFSYMFLVFSLSFEFTFIWERHTMLSEITQNIVRVIPTFTGCPLVCLFLRNPFAVNYNFFSKYFH